MLERFIIECAWKEANGEVLAKDLLDESSPILKGDSFFSQLKSMHYRARTRNKVRSH